MNLTQDNELHASSADCRQELFPIFCNLCARIPVSESEIQYFSRGVLAILRKNELTHATRPRAEAMSEPAELSEWVCHENLQARRAANCPAGFSRPLGTARLPRMFFPFWDGGCHMRASELASRDAAATRVSLTIIGIIALRRRFIEIGSLCPAMRKRRAPPRSSKPRRILIP
jgi:hypothetical protein